LDQLIDEILNAKILFGLSTDSEIKNYLKHFETLRRIKVVDNKGIESYSWDSTTGEDHYVFATLYWYLATLGNFGVGKWMPEALRGTDSKMLIGRDNTVGDIGEMLAHNNDWPFEDNTIT
jgi:hypothetical protein